MATIGIDLGTTNSCAAVVEGGKPTIIHNAEGSRTTPSVVAFTKDGERLVGATACRQAAINPDCTISSVKRHMGSDWRASIDGKRFTPQEISAMILRKLRRDAEAFLGQEVTQAVITVPAYFNDMQRQATKDAGRIAGLDVLRIINEPTSAALAYGLDNGDPQKVMVYDLGGGTFDVSIIEIGEGVIEVLATAGDNHLGGDDFDERVANYLFDAFKRETGVDASRDAAAAQRVREAARQAKEELSSMETARVNLPFLAQGASGPLHLEAQVTRSEFNRMTADLVERTEGPVSQALNDAGIAASELGSVLLVGGSTRIPAVQDKVRSLTGKEPSSSINPDECVAVGAAIQGATLAGSSTGLVKANSILLLDVTPLSLSLETVGGVATRIVERNTTLPVHYSQIFTTAAAFQTSVEINVLQGERPMARDNKSIGKFRLKGIKRPPRGRTSNRGHVRHRCERHSHGFREGQGDGQGAVDHDRRVGPHVRRGNRSRHSRCGNLRGAGRDAPRCDGGSRRGGAPGARGGRGAREGGQAAGKGREEAGQSRFECSPQASLEEVREVGGSGYRGDSLRKRPARAIECACEVSGRIGLVGGFKSENAKKWSRIGDVRHRSRPKQPEAPFRICVNQQKA